MNQPNYELVCFSHLRWNFVYQRPQHLMSRAARDRRVFFIEEPVFEEGIRPHLQTYQDGGVTVVTPHLPPAPAEDKSGWMLRELVDDLLREMSIQDYVLWIYSPMPMPYLASLEPKAVIYDCMDELANFRFAPFTLKQRERQLLGWADVVFTGGQSLYEAKLGAHDNLHPFPSSVDVAHFAKARRPQAEPKDMAQLRRPRVGFYGVIDERMDLDLLGQVAVGMPDVEFVMVGPFAKVDPAEMPRRENLHFLGQKTYAELPQYLAHWDVAMLPFALNDSTRFISPTKTPEYLAAGKPVVSTPIADVVRPYGDKGLVYIAGDAAAFQKAIHKALSEPQKERKAQADAFIARMSWDRTWAKMEAEISAAVAKNSKVVVSVATPARPALTPGGRNPNQA